MFGENLVSYGSLSFYGTVIPSGHYAKVSFYSDSGSIDGTTIGIATDAIAMEGTLVSGFGAYLLFKL